MAEGSVNRYGTQNLRELQKSGKVNNLCQQWLVHEDAALANQLQNAEFVTKQNRNVAERNIARCDVPMAHVLLNEEEIRLQTERMLDLERLKAISEDDARLAERIHTRQLLSEERQREDTERTDEELARRLQEKERRRYELLKREKELRRQRRRLERQIQEQIYGDTGNDTNRHTDRDTGRDRDRDIGRHTGRDIEGDTGRDTGRDPGRSINEMLGHSDNRPSRSTRERLQDLEVPDLSRRTARQEQYQVSDGGGSGREQRQRAENDRHTRNHNSAANAQSVNNRRTEDSGDLLRSSDDYMTETMRLEAQEAQDRELAILLQEQEHKRRGRGRRREEPEQDQGERDADLARRLDEEERRRSRRQHRQEHSRNQSSRQQQQQQHVTSNEDVNDEGLELGSSASDSQSRRMDHNPSHYASRPLPETPSSPVMPTRLPQGYNMSLIRALDHNIDTNRMSEEMSRLNVNSSGNKESQRQNINNNIYANVDMDVGGFELNGRADNARERRNEGGHGDGQRGREEWGLEGEQRGRGERGQRFSEDVRESSQRRRRKNDLRPKCSPSYEEAIGRHTQKENGDVERLQAFDSNNVFSAIDPTYNRRKEVTQQTQSEPKVTPAGAGYCYLDNIRVRTGGDTILHEDDDDDDTFSDEDDDDDDDSYDDDDDAENDDNGVQEAVRGDKRQGGFSRDARRGSGKCKQQ